jgi:hypothetical protein
MGAGGGIRTRTPFRTMDFESIMTTRFHHPGESLNYAEYWTSYLFGPMMPSSLATSGRRATETVFQ